MGAAPHLRLTPQQEKAITHRRDSIALSAGAGCGKTFVLTQRFLAHLEEGVPLSRLVAITFTERAAREMRDRIRAALRERLVAAASDADARRWREIDRELHSARIHTIHAFCAALLRGHAVEAELDPSFLVLDDAQSQTLLAETVDDELRRLLSEVHTDVLDLVVAFDLPWLRVLLQELLAQRDRIDFAAWRDRPLEVVLDLWQAAHRKSIVPQALRGVTDCEAAVQLRILLAENVPSNDEMRRRRSEILDNLEALQGATNPQVILTELHDAARVQGGGGANAWPDESVYENVRDRLTELRGQIAAAATDLCFDRDAARPAAELGLKLLRLTESVAERFSERKRELAALDFDDLLIRTRDLLVASAVRAPSAELLDGPKQADHGGPRTTASALAGSVGGQIHSLLVDEFQDTDPLQVELVKSLCGEGMRQGKLFVVGDYKQSIYRFRRADPRVFESLQQEIPAAGRIPLTTNYRSQPQILAFVNALFADAMGDGYEPLVAHRPQTTAPPCVEFLWAPAADENGKEQNSVLRQREADWVARRIRQMIQDERPLVAQGGAAPSTRPVMQKDVAILFRALSDAPMFEDALRRYGIEYYLVGGHAFYAQQEIFDVLNLLKSLADRNDQVALAGVLRSPLFNLADETLYWLATNGRGLSQGLFRTPPPQLDDDQRRRVDFAARTIKHLRGVKDRLPIAALLNEALRLTGYDAVLVAEFLGERKLANLRKLIDQARSFDQSGLFALDDFITQLAVLVSGEPREPLAAAHAEDANVVRLMTIHQAKGLEFPVVFVPDLARPNRSSHRFAVFDAELGPLVKPRDFDQVTPLDWFNAAEKLEDDAERTRLLYVAVTRAADYLVLSSGVQKRGQANTPWLKLLAAQFELETGAIKGALPSGWEAPRIAVTMTAPSASESGSAERRGNLLSAAEEVRRRSSRAGVQPPRSAAPVSVDVQARREYSFSRLSGTLREIQQAAESEAIEPAWKKPADVDPIGLGTLVHAVFEEVEFSPAGLAQVETLVRRQADLHLPESPEDVGAAIEMIRRLLASQRATKLAQAKTVYRELEFLLAWPPQNAAQSAAQSAGQGGAYFRGFIDCLYEDAAGDWHLLDYKTNRVAAGAVPREAERYELQLLVYGLAVRQVLGRSPVDASLHFLRPGAEHTIKWSERAGDQAVERVNQVLAAFVEQETRRCESF